MKFTTQLTVNRKKRQRRFVRYLRQINKNVMDDDLWRGRFEMRQVGAEWVTQSFRGITSDGREFYDPYGTLIAKVKIKDKLTGKTEEYTVNTNITDRLEGYDLWRLMNDFINSIPEAIQQSREYNEQYNKKGEG